MAGEKDGYPGMPRWVKIFAIASVALVLLVVLVVAFSPGDHGPMRHGGASPASGDARDTLPRGDSVPRASGDLPEAPAPIRPRSPGASA